MKISRKFNKKSEEVKDLKRVRRRRQYDWVPAVSGGVSNSLPIVSSNALGAAAQVTTL